MQRLQSRRKRNLRTLQDTFLGDIFVPVALSNTMSAINMGWK